MKDYQIISNKKSILILLMKILHFFFLNFKIIATTENQIISGLPDQTPIRLPLFRCIQIVLTLTNFLLLSFCVLLSLEILFSFLCQMKQMLRFREYSQQHTNK